MKNYKLQNIGDRIKILHCNKKNPLRKDDLGKEGTVVEVRPSYVKVQLDGDDRIKNYNYKTFKTIESANERRTETQNEEGSCNTEV